MGTIFINHRRLLERILIGLVAGILPLALFRNLEMLRGFELRLRSLLIYERGTRLPHDDVFLVTIDNQTVAKLGWPLPRQHYAELIRTLNQYGARVVAFDVFFDQLREKAMDDSLAAASQSFDTVIHAFDITMYGDGYEDPNPGLVIDSLFLKYAIHPQNENCLKFFYADTAAFPHPRFAQAFNQAGLLSLMLGEADRFERLPLVFKYAGHTFPSLGLLAWCKYLGASPDSIRFGKNFWGYYARLETAEQIYEIPLNQRGQSNLNYYGPIEMFPTYSIWQIHQAVQDLKAGRAPQVHLASFKNKLVIIGMPENDTFVTPYSAAFPGMGIFATAVSNFLNGETLRELPWYVDLGIVLALALLLNGAVARAGKINKARTTVYAIFAFAALTLLYNGLAYEILFKEFNVIPAILATNCALVAIFSGLVFYEKTMQEKTLKLKTNALQERINQKLAEITNLNAVIAGRDQEHKDMEQIIENIEMLLGQRADELPQAFRNPLDKLKNFCDKMQTELTTLHLQKQKLELANKGLSDQLQTLIPQPAERPGESNPLHEISAEAAQKKLEVARWVVKHYHAFVQKAKVGHYFHPDFNMATAVLNGDGEKAKMQEIFDQIKQFASFDTRVLITGENGTGKTHLAEAIHRYSPRKNGPLKTIAIPALAEGLLESEIFGHEKGAFTNAFSARKGAFENAHHGTIFLDEIGDLKPHLQVKLLQVIQDRKFQRAGGNETIEVDVRIIAATNRDLPKLIQENQFRQDLYYRLKVAHVHLPPLRECKEDIPHLVSYFLTRLNESNQRHKRIADDALTALIFYDWPGNVRELQNAIERAFIKHNGVTIRLDDLDEEIQQLYAKVCSVQPVLMWNDILKTAEEEMQNIFNRCRELLREGKLDLVLSNGQQQLGDSPCKNCFEHLKSYLDNKGSMFEQEKREILAKQTIVALADQFIDWCKKEEVYDSMEQAWKEIEKLMGRGRRQLNNWKSEYGYPPFYRPTEVHASLFSQ